MEGSENVDAVEDVDGRGSSSSISVRPGRMSRGFAFEDDIASAFARERDLRLKLEKTRIQSVPACRIRIKGS